MVRCKLIVRNVVAAALTLSLTVGISSAAFVPASNCYQLIHAILIHIFYVAAKVSLPIVNNGRKRASIIKDNTI